MIEESPTDVIDNQEVVVEIGDEADVSSSANIRIIVFVNTRSGGQSGKNLYQPLCDIYGEDNVFDMFVQPIGPEKGLKDNLLLQNDNLRILVAGGDGTVNWVIDTIAKLLPSNNEYKDVKWPPIAILPLGTGNDLSRQFKWGHGYIGQDLNRIRDAMLTAIVQDLDRWVLTIESSSNDSDDDNDSDNDNKPKTLESDSYQEIEMTKTGKKIDSEENEVNEGDIDENEKEKIDNKEVDKDDIDDKVADTTPSTLAPSPPSTTSATTPTEPNKEMYTRAFINYFGIGVDGKMVTKFENLRKSCPWLFCCRCMNNAIYGWFGATDPCLSNRMIAENFELSMNGQKVDIPKKSKGLMMLNIQSFMGGVQLWSRNDDLPASSHDEQLDATSVNGTVHLGMIKFDMTNADCIGQGHEIIIKPKNANSKYNVMAQIDGEALLLPCSSVCKVNLLNKVAMLIGPIDEPPLCDICC